MFKDQDESLPTQAAEDQIRGLSNRQKPRNRGKNAHDYRSTDGFGKSRKNCDGEEKTQRINPARGSLSQTHRKSLLPAHAICWDIADIVHHEHGNRE